MTGLTITQQKKIRENIKGRGMTVPGWSRANGHNYHSVSKALYSDEGRRKNLTPVIAKIVEDFISQGFTK